VGERVWVWNGQWTRPFGTAAEFIGLPATQTGVLPEKTSFDAGACLGIPAMTAAHAVALADVGKGTTILVSGGAGAVSQYVLQFAKAKGAICLTTISSPEKAKAAREAGADHTIDYKRDNVGERVMELTGNCGIDVLIEMDLTANAKLIPVVMRPKGSVIVYGTGPEATIQSAFCLVNSIRLQYFLVYELDATERERAIATVDNALKQGALLNRVAQPTYKLENVAVAHEAVELGSVGNVLLMP
jgi:NADPH2:quinone reductase